MSSQYYAEEHITPTERLARVRQQKQAVFRAAQVLKTASGSRGAASSSAPPMPHPQPSRSMGQQREEIDPRQRGAVEQGETVADGSDEQQYSDDQLIPLWKRIITNVDRMLNDLAEGEQLAVIRNMDQYHWFWQQDGPSHYAFKSDLLACTTLPPLPKFLKFRSFVDVKMRAWPHANNVDVSNALRLAVRMTPSYQGEIGNRKQISPYTDLNFNIWKPSHDRKTASQLRNYERRHIQPGYRAVQKKELRRVFSDFVTLDDAFNPGTDMPNMNIKVLFLQTDAANDFIIGTDDGDDQYSSDAENDDSSSDERGRRSKPSQRKYGQHNIFVLNLLGRFRVVQAVDGVCSMEDWLWVVSERFVRTQDKWWECSDVMQFFDDFYKMATSTNKDLMCFGARSILGQDVKVRGTHRRHRGVSYAVQQLHYHDLLDSFHLLQVAILNEQIVMVDGLKKATQLNGRTGIVIGVAGDRVLVKFERNEKPKSICPENITKKGVENSTISARSSAGTTMAENQ